MRSADRIARAVGRTRACTVVVRGGRIVRAPRPDRAPGAQPDGRAHGGQRKLRSCRSQARARTPGAALEVLARGNLGGKPSTSLRSTVRARVTISRGAATMNAMVGFMVASTTLIIPALRPGSDKGGRDGGRRADWPRRAGPDLLPRVTGGGPQR